MSALLDRPITFVESIGRPKKTGRLTLGEFADALKRNEWQARIEAIRSEPDEDKAKKLKAALPAVMFAGFFSSRVAPVAEKLVSASGLLSLDIDGLGAGIARDLKARLTRDPHVALAFISPRGNGLKLVLPFEGGSYEPAFACAAKHVQERYKLRADSGCKDIGRLCFVSCDDSPVVNENAHPIVVKEAPPSTARAPISTTTYNLQATPLPATPYTPTPLHTTHYTTEGVDGASLARAHRAAATKLDKLRLSDPGFVWCYEKLILERYPAMAGGRNAWLEKVVPFLFRATAYPVAERIALVFLEVNASLFHATPSEHLKSFVQLWEGCDAAYAPTLSTAERELYGELVDQDRAAFRICRDLGSKDGTFFLASDQLAFRLGGCNAHRLLKRFVSWGVLAVLVPGTRRGNGQARATTYRWQLRPSEQHAAAA